MDLISIPACAMFRSVGTVIVRIRMEVQGGCCGGQGRSSSRPVSDMSSPLPSGSEQCNRTRLISKHKSDCESVVEKLRPYRSSTARSRYVNVCAAVCLVLVVGSLSTHTMAAPSRRVPVNKHLWENPCDYTDGGKTVSSVQELADKLAKQAVSANKTAFEYSDELAFQLHSFPQYNSLDKLWGSYDWLRTFPWYRDEVLPKEKKFSVDISDEYLRSVEANQNEVLPYLHKGMKLIVAAFWAFSDGLDETMENEKIMKPKIIQTFNDVRAVLCYFTDYMKVRNLEILQISDSEIPDFSTDGNKLFMSFLVYRDTLIYLEYISQIFKKLSAADVTV